MYLVTIFFWEDTKHWRKDSRLSNNWKGFQDGFLARLALGGRRRFLQQDWSIWYEDSVVELDWESKTSGTQCVHYESLLWSILNAENCAAPPLMRDFANLSIIDCSMLRWDCEDHHGDELNHLLHSMEGRRKTFFWSGDDNILRNWIRHHAILAGTDVFISTWSLVSQEAMGEDLADPLLQLRVLLDLAVSWIVVSHHSGHKSTKQTVLQF